MDVERIGEMTTLLARIYAIDPDAILSLTARAARARDCGQSRRRFSDTLCTVDAPASPLQGESVR
jgi:hypothetical protein